MSEFPAKHGGRWLRRCWSWALAAARLNLLGVDTLFREFGRGVVGVMAAFLFVVAVLLLSTVRQECVRMTAASDRRRFRFTLRTLFAAVTIACVWLGWEFKCVQQRGGLRAVHDHYDLVPGINGFGGFSCSFQVRRKKMNGHPPTIPTIKPGWAIGPLHSLRCPSNPRPTHSSDSFQKRRSCLHRPHLQRVVRSNRGSLWHSPPFNINTLRAAKELPPKPGERPP